MLKPYYVKVRREFAEFREDKLWDSSVEVIFTMNEKALTELYRNYAAMNWGKNGKPFKADFMTVHECLQLLKFDSPLKLERAIIRQAFALCKMTVVNEFDSKAATQYMAVSYVEFLELIARIAELSFRDTEMEDL